VTAAGPRRSRSALALLKPADAAGAPLALPKPADAAGVAGCAPLALPKPADAAALFGSD